MSGFAKLSDGFGKSTTDLKRGFSGFGSNKYVAGTKQFLDSNSIVAKVAFLLLLVIVFVLLLRLGVYIMSWAFAPNKNPKLVSGMKDAKKYTIIQQNPALSSSKPVLRSVNQQDGIEFTYSTWIYIDDLQYGKGQYRHIFHKGNDNIVTSGKNVGLNFPNNGPGLYIHPTKNALVVIMNTFSNINEEIIVSDIPLNKWINVIIRVEGNNVDIYINGTIVMRHVLKDVPKQNYGDVYVNMNGGFSGFLSDLWYHDYALNTTEILTIVQDGPNMKMDQSMDIFPPYFSLRWYLGN